MKPRRAIVLFASLAAALASANSARAEERHHEHEGDEGKGKTGSSAPLQLTAAQSEFREKLLGQQRLFVRDVARSAGGKLGPEKREAIELHWRHLASLLRVRELAEQDNDAAVVTKVDELRDREDEKFAALMQRLNDAGTPAAPGRGGAQ